MEELHQIAFHCVGEGGPGGDAITIAYQTANGLVVDVVDGGTLDSGTKLIEWMQREYGEEVNVRNILCTHGDQNHVSGVRPILEAFDIEALYANFPWHYTSGSVSRELKEHFATLAELENTVPQNKLRSAFQGTRVGMFEILAPSFDRFQEMAATLHQSPNVVRRVFSGVAEAALELVPDSWDTERLEEFATAPTSPSNESSVVQFAEFGTFRVLLTGDAGVDALTEAADYAEGSGIVLPIQSSLENPLIIQMPHHGSRHNISTEVLDRWLGPRVPSEDHQHQYALACVGKESDTHPRRKTVNAFVRRGCAVRSTADGDPVIHPLDGARMARAHSFSSHVES